MKSVPGLSLILSTMATASADDDGRSAPGGGDDPARAVVIR